MNALGVKKDPNEVIDRPQIHQIKQELTEKFKSQTFSAADLRSIAFGQSELTLLIEDLHIKELHINLIYAFVELSQEGRIEIVDRNPFQCRIKS